MKRKIIIASHNHMASGLKSTLEFIAGKQDNVQVLDAYVDGSPIEENVKEMFEKTDDDTEIIVFTDMLAGSVNQKFFPYRTRSHTHIITGMNLPVVLAFALESADKYISVDRIHEIITESRNALQYVNEFQVDDDEEDE
ncbi:PTS sugar transporter subunit IIA [Companilactobacillus nuruki]|uniref:PTS N-acetylglucosamine transporter subunit IIBC n=1 Tax=Companilactobacillus nuruki TaxID=1993540 RepID=A0A2N7AXP1_9LACO|nr:PTS N-acetylglucosamine transporter subunit IIBC [Companilactobacillus nuruki]PMD73857.1 PTS N-acetylglucosamine transporter subunit IIBC [Companilactobacillus nuruki]